jgi:hypothetical protein
MGGLGCGSTVAVAATEVAIVSAGIFALLALGQRRKSFYRRRIFLPVLDIGS